WCPSGSCQGCQSDGKIHVQPIQAHPDQSDRVQSEVVQAKGDCQPRPYDWRCHSSTVLQTAAVLASSNRSACAFPGKNIPYAVSGSDWPSAGTAPDYRKNVHHSGIVLAIAAAGSNPVQSAAVNDIPRSA